MPDEMIPWFRSLRMLRESLAYQAVFCRCNRNTPRPRWRCHARSSVVQGAEFGCHQEWTGSRKPGSIHPRRQPSLDDMPPGLTDSHVPTINSHTVAVLLGEYRGSNQQAVRDSTGHSRLNVKIISSVSCP